MNSRVVAGADNVTFPTGRSSTWRELTDRFPGRYHDGMVRRRDLLTLAERQSAGLKFRELCFLAEAVGYRLDRQVGSHLIYWHPTRPDVPRLNLQRGSSGDAKPYQVRQVLRIVREYGLEVEE